MKIFGFGFSKCIFRAVNVNLWKSDKPVSKVCIFINEFGKFGNIKFIHFGLFGTFIACGIFGQAI